MKWKLLFAGESWFITTTETKGVDQFTVGGYQTEINRVVEVMADYTQITHIPAHLVAEQFPDTAEELSAYDAVIISDVGANTFLLHPDTFYKAKQTPNKLREIARYVENGGAFGMMGGYLSFQGIGAKAQYHNTPIEEILPVTISPYDDRRECPEGIVLSGKEHPLFSDFPPEWPPLLGYNRLTAKEGAEVALCYQGDPILSFGRYGSGKTFAFASDCAPHWMPEEFCNWRYCSEFWRRVLQAVCR